MKKVQRLEIASREEAIGSATVQLNASGAHPEHAAAQLAVDSHPARTSLFRKFALVVVASVFALSLGLLSGCDATSNYTPQPTEQKVDDSLLHTPGTLRVGVDASNAPYAAESQGAIVGIDVDVAAALADELGLKLELVDIGSTADQAFTSEDVDIVMGVGSDAQNCWVSEPYLTSSIVLFAAEENTKTPDPNGTYAVAAQASSMSAVEVTNRLGEGVLEATSDIQTAFDQMKAGTANFVATDSTIGSYVANSSDMDIYPVALLSEQTNYCIGAPNTAAGLQDAVSEALKKLQDGGVLTVIDQKWLGNAIDLTSLSIIEPIPEPEPAEGEGAENEDTEGSSSSSSGTSSSSSSGN